MIGVYFSGTGNTRHCVEMFMRNYDLVGETVSIEEENVLQKIDAHTEMLLGYPVQFSNLPKILWDFIVHNSHVWNGKHIFILATMGLFSGDGAGILARLLTRYGAVIAGGLHLKMPDCIGDKKALKRTLVQNQELVRKAERKIEKAVQELKNNQPSKNGIGFFNHMAGLFGQRLYFYQKTKEYSDHLNINANQCIRCGKCVSLCPMKNIVWKDGQVLPSGKCTMCYRCVSFCPTQAITLLGKRVYEQCYLEKYL